MISVLDAIIYLDITAVDNTPVTSNETWSLHSIIDLPAN